MTTFDHLSLDHVHYLVRDLDVTTDRWTNRFGLSVHGRSPRTGPGAKMIALGGGDIRLVLTEAGDADTPESAFVTRHGDGVADIALGVPDAAAAFAEAVRRGARPVRAPETRDGMVTAAIAAFGDMIHTFVQRPSFSDRWLPGLEPVTPVPARGNLELLDHFAICVEAGQLAATVEFYERVLDFELVYTEHFVLGQQGMTSMVVRNRRGDVTLTLVEPDSAREPGQLDQFIKDHGGAGVQHIAFATADIVREVSRLSRDGVAFLRTPSSYYDLLPRRIDLVRHSPEQLRELNILVDQDQDGQLMQIFTKSDHPRGTLYYEIIERAGARTFGSGNIRALYEAAELARARDRAR